MSTRVRLGGGERDMGEVGGWPDVESMTSRVNRRGRGRESKGRLRTWEREENRQRKFQA